MNPVSRNDFIQDLTRRYEGKVADWHNMNHTLSTKAVKISVLDGDRLAGLITEINTWNQTNGGQAINLVAVAGWDDKETPQIVDVLEIDNKLKPKKSFFKGCFKRVDSAENILDKTKLKVEQLYHDSFSLNPNVTTGSQEDCHADFIVHFPPEYQKQKLKIIKEDDKTYLKIPAGVRFSDIDQYLLDEGYALPPTAPTVQYVSAVGAAATGSYGPTAVERPISTYIVEMTVIDPQGKIITLSKNKNPEIFDRVRDAHLGAGFIVLDMVIEGVEEAYKLKRTDMMLKYDEVASAMEEKNPLLQEHFVGHYFPSPHNEKRCFRYTTFERTDEPETKAIVSSDCLTVLDNFTTTLGEPVIEHITNTPALHKLFTPILDAAMVKTFGDKEKEEHVRQSADAYHLLKTYTHSKFTDHNFLIPVDDPESGREILTKLLDWWHAQLQAIYKKEGIVPVLTIYMRHTKGIEDLDGKTGIAPTVVSKKGQTVLSFEPLTYQGFANIPEYQKLLHDFKVYMKEELGLTYREHPGKTPTTDRLANNFTDKLGKKRLEGFRDAIKALHTGPIDRSALMTPAKRDYIFGQARREDKAIGEHFAASVNNKMDPETYHKALQRIIDLAGKHNLKHIQNDARKLLLVA